MVLGFGQSKAEDITSLIGRKQYGKAIEAIKTQISSRRGDPRLRLQLADVLVLAGKGKEAVAILTPLADEFAREGFAAKAISVFKKIQKIDPSRRDVDSKLASLIRKKQDEAVPAAASSPGPEMGLEIGMEEIGFEPPSAGPVSVPAAPVPPPPPAPAEPEIGSEISFEPPSGGPVTVPAPSRRMPAPSPPEPELFAPTLDAEPIAFQPAPDVEVEPLLVEPEPEPTAPPPTAARAPVPPPAAAKKPPAPVVDRDLILDEVDLEPEPAPLEVEPLLMEPEPGPDQPLVLADPEPDEPPDTMTDSLFAEELLSLVEDAFKDVPIEEGVPAQAEDAAEPGGGGAQIVVSPLFKDFSVDELVAVIQGLNLVSFEAGDIIITQGEPGNSLYMLTAGSVKAFVKNPRGRQVQVHEFNEGAFFGEGSILTGKPRSATLIASTRCELLELDRPTLDSIVQTHPHVLEVMQDFARQRTARPA